MPALPSLKQLQYLVALADRLNFTRAAEDCHVTQSTLSAGLKELEDGLGTRLVERDRQNVLMTPLGEDVARRARDILAAAQDLVALASGASEPMCGTLRLGVIPTIAPFLLPPALRLLRERYPSLRLSLREDLTAHLLARLREGQLDFALIALPYDTGTLKVEALFDDALCVVGRQDDPQVKARAVAITPALAERLLLLEEGHCLREHALQACATTAHGAHAELAATSLLTLVQMVESGFGIGLVPEMAVRHGIAAGTHLVSRTLARPAPSRTIALAMRASGTRAEEFSMLSDLFREAAVKLS
jgi:LysR family hydrogen peroxide-inducible transcriptional activator